MNAMNNRLAKQRSPGHDRIDMQRIIIAGELGKRDLICKCENTVAHRTLILSEQSQYLLNLVKRAGKKD